MLVTLAYQLKLNLSLFLRPMEPALVPSFRNTKWTGVVDSPSTRMAKLHRELFLG